MESTLTEPTELKQVINEINNSSSNSQSPSNNDEYEKQVDAITEELYQHLIVEMKLELDLLLISDPRRMSTGKAYRLSCVLDNLNLSESGRFVMLERRGIKTDLFAIERYVEEVQDEVMSKFPHPPPI